MEVRTKGEGKGGGSVRSERSDARNQFARTVEYRGGVFYSLGSTGGSRNRARLRRAVPQKGERGKPSPQSSVTFILEPTSMKGGVGVFKLLDQKSMFVRKIGGGMRQIKLEIALLATGPFS